MSSERESERVYTYITGTKGRIRWFLNINILMFYICRMHKKAEIVKNMSFRAFYKVHTVSHNATSLKIGCFFKGV